MQPICLRLSHVQCGFFSFLSVNSFSNFTYSEGILFLSWLELTLWMRMRLRQGTIVVVVVAWCCGTNSATLNPRDPFSNHLSQLSLYLLYPNPTFNIVSIDYMIESCSCSSSSCSCSSRSLLSSRTPDATFCGKSRLGKVLLLRFLKLDSAEATLATRDGSSSCSVSKVGSCGWRTAPAQLNFSKGLYFPFQFQLTPSYTWREGNQGSDLKLGALEVFWQWRWFGTLSFVKTLVMPAKFRPDELRCTRVTP
jgi:hypothetical protein